MPSRCTPCTGHAQRTCRASSVSSAVGGRSPRSVLTAAGDHHRHFIGSARGDLLAAAVSDQARGSQCRQGLGVADRVAAWPLPALRFAGMPSGWRRKEITTPTLPPTTTSRSCAGCISEAVAGVRGSAPRVGSGLKMWTSTSGRAEVFERGDCQKAQTVPRRASASNSG